MTFRQLVRTTLVVLAVGPAAVAVCDAPPPSGSSVPVEDYDVPPRPLHITKPEYPPSALAKGVEGTVLMEILIDSSGRVVRAKALNSINELNRAAFECVSRWEFAPAMKDGKPVATIAQAPVTFKRPPKKSEPKKSDPK